MLLERFEDTGISLSARLDSEVISLADTAAFFTFLRDAVEVSLRYPRQQATPSLEEDLPRVITNVAVSSGSVKAIVQVLKSREFQIGVASSLTASIIWAAATAVWPQSVQIETNVPQERTAYRIPIDPAITALVEEMGRTGKSWSIEIFAKDPHYPSELKIIIKGNLSTS
jgi:hypothetical protein